MYGICIYDPLSNQRRLVDVKENDRNDATRKPLTTPRQRLLTLWYWQSKPRGKKRQPTYWIQSSELSAMQRSTKGMIMIQPITLKSWLWLREFNEHHEEYAPLRNALIEEAKHIIVISVGSRIRSFGLNRPFVTWECDYNINFGN